MATWTTQMRTTRRNDRYPARACARAGDIMLALQAQRLGFDVNLLDENEVWPDDDDDDLDEVGDIDADDRQRRFLRGFLKPDRVCPLSEHAIADVFVSGISSVFQHDSTPVHSAQVNWSKLDQFSQDMDSTGTGCDDPAVFVCCCCRAGP